MTKARVVMPGTVSKILWHFTGGPIWDPTRKRQSNRPKPPDQAYANLKSILKSRVLRLGNYKEVVRVVLPAYRLRKRKSKRSQILPRGPIDVESSPVCCLSDIPTPHLSYHAHRYGKFALGFRRDAVVQAGFNPVFYTLHNTPTICSIYRGFAAINRANVEGIRSAVSGIGAELGDIQDDTHDMGCAELELDEISFEADLIDKRLSTARKSLSDFVAFVKTFERTEFNTIYCEREWRSIQPFKFGIDGLAMVVLPRMSGRTHYFHRLVNKSAIGRTIPRDVPIVAWEDLVES